MGIIEIFVLMMKVLLVVAAAVTSSEAFSPSSVLVTKQCHSRIMTVPSPLQSFVSAPIQMASSLDESTLSRRGMFGKLAGSATLAAAAAVAFTAQPAAAATSGFYKDVEVATDKEDVLDPRDRAANYKSKEETDKKKGDYTNLLWLLIAISFVVPMAQYFWYVKDD